MAHLGNRAKQRRTREIFLGTLAILLVLAIIIGVGYFLISKPEGIDSTTLCPAEGPRGHFVIMVDKTDPMTFTQKAAFMVDFREIIETRVPEGYLLSVFALGEDFKANAEPLIEVCNPGTGADKSELTSNIKQLSHQYKNRFVEPILKQSESLLSSSSANISPIIEMLQMVGINAFRKHNVKGERRLIIVSDMLHNTPQFSMYKAPVDYTTFSASVYGRKAQLELKNVDIELIYLINSPQLQTKRNLQFWEEYFNKSGARIVAVRPLEG